MSPAYQQNPDKSWTPATPLPYAPGIDWEVYPDYAVAYRGSVELVRIRRRRGLLWAQLYLATGLRCGWRPWEPVRVLQ